MISPESIRQAIQAAPFELDNTGETPLPGTLYIPLAHRKALARDAVLVIGGRGVGKSFWTAALSDASLRQLIGAQLPELTQTTIHVGHAAKSSIQTYPDRDTFKALLDLGHRPSVVWRAVVARWLAGLTHTSVPEGSWNETVDWAKQNTEKVADLAETANKKLAANNQFGLILFDALDRTSHDWETMNHIVRDLLQLSLWLRGFSQIRAKVFLRPDQMERTVTSFVDASKITATSVDLTWEEQDLHAMLWQRLINAPGKHGECLRSVITKRTSNPIITPKEPIGSWFLPYNLASNDFLLRQLFVALAGYKMGKDARRGVPYVWSVSHLADGHGRTSPRSFLAAILGAAEDSSRYSDYPLALHYESLKRGIQKASKIRVEQVAEDDPWVPAAMQPLRGMNVPCEEEAVITAWQAAFPQGPGSIPSDHLPPQHAGSWDGVRKDLERLGIFVTRKDHRLDMPDLYRVGFGLGRKGGIRPRA